MIRFNTITLSALILSASLVHAQTGPTGPVSPPPATNNNSSVSQNLSPDRVDSYLRSKGHTTKITRLSNGVATVHAKVQHDGWQFEVDFEFSADQKNFCMTCKLGSPQSQYSPAQLMALLKKNYDMAMTLHFCYRETDRQLCLDFPCFPTTLNETMLQNNMNLLLKVVRETHPLWDTSRWPMTQVAGTAPSATPAPTPAPPQPVVNSGLEKTTWTGTEMLDNYGKLEFLFGEKGFVIMIDTAGQSEGIYREKGNQVTMTFGGCVYTGTINGNTITGMAQQAGKSWTFSVSR